MGRPMIYLEREDRPGEKFAMAAAARMAGVNEWAVYYAKREAKRGQWFPLGRLRFRVMSPAKKRAEAKTADPLRDALARGCDLCTETDVKMARGWADGVRRAAEDLEAVLSGKADLVIDGGRVCVLRRDLKWTGYHAN